MTYVYYKTPFCILKITELDGHLHNIDFVKRAGLAVTQDKLLAEAQKQIQGYLASGKFVFDLPLNPEGTEFQRRVWAELQKIPAGEVRTYGDISAILHSSPRAVGNACRKNPIPLIIPCHRVVSQQGIGGFAGQTQGHKITIKQQLLRHEGVEI